MTSPLRPGSQSLAPTPRREVYATREGTTFFVETIPWPMRCKTSLDPACVHPTYTLFVSVPTCGHHLVTEFRNYGVKPRGPLPECAT